MNAVVRPLEKNHEEQHRKTASECVLELEGFVGIQETALYSLAFLKRCYPPDIYRLIAASCPVILSDYVYGKSWIAALESAISYNSNSQTEVSLVETMLSIEDVANLTNIGRDTVERNIHQGYLIASDHSSNPGAGRALWRIRRQDLEEFIAKRQAIRPASSIAQVRPISKRNQQRE